jgi:hypothetical protein
MIDKSTLLTHLLGIEIHFFSKRANDNLMHQVFQEAISLTKKRTEENNNCEQVLKWLKNNELFGQALDKTKDYTDRRFDKKPRIKTNMETNKRYLDKAKFLTKFSCFDGYM